MPDAIYIPGGIIVPPNALEQKAVRSAGPGGQNVNKVCSKIELRLDLSRIQGLSVPARRRLIHMAHRRIDSSGRLIVTSQRFRDQGRNLEDARAKIRQWISRACVPKKQRIRTRPRTASIRLRLERKRRHSALKEARRRGPDDDY